MIHKLKALNPYFSDILDGMKTFEIRKNDRNFQIGDQLLLQEYDLYTNKYLERNCLCNVIYIVFGGQFGIEKGFVVMGIEKCK